MFYKQKTGATKEWFIPQQIGTFRERNLISLSLCWLWAKILAVLLQNPVGLWWSLVLGYMLLDSNTSKNSCTESDQASLEIQALLPQVWNPLCAEATSSGFSSTKSSLLTGTLELSRRAEAYPWQFVFSLQSPVSWFLTIWPSHPLGSMFFFPL